MLAAETEVVSPPTRFHFEGHELEWTAKTTMLPVLVVTVSVVGSDEGCFLLFRVEERPTEHLAREVATKMRHLLSLGS